MTVTPHVLPPLLATVACLSMMVVAWSRRQAPGARSYAALMLTVAHWAFFQAVLVFAPDLEAQIVVSKVQYLGIAFAPAATLAFALDYTDRGDWLRGWRLAALVALPAATVALAATNEMHGLVWARIAPSTRGPLPLPDLTYGPWFRVHLVYAYALALGAGVLLCMRLAEAPHLRPLLVGLLSALGLVLVVNLSYLAGVRALGGLDPTPTGFAVASVIMGWCLYRYRLFDLVPLAREAVFDGIADPVIVIDPRGRIRDLNVAARLRIASARSPMGRPAGEVLPAPLPAVLEHLRDGGRAEVAIQDDDEHRTYDAVVARLGADEAPAGRLLVLRDVTERKESEVALLQVQEELRHANSELVRLAHTDALTGLTNRRQWMKSLETESARMARHQISLGVVMIDIDHFKRVNDRYGHPVGDRVLEAVARVIETERRAHDVAARIGGEEFALLVSHASEGGMAIVAERLRGRIELLTHDDGAGHSFGVTASLGTALLASGDDASSVLRRADAALYRAKERGRNRVVADAEPA